MENVSKVVVDESVISRFHACAQGLRFRETVGNPEQDLDLRGGGRKGVESGGMGTRQRRRQRRLAGPARATNLQDLEIGFFEDDDYCNRVGLAGYRIGIAENVFVHHHLSASFDTLDRERRNEIFEKNKQRYERKWGSWKPHSYREEA